MYASLSAGVRLCQYSLTSDSSKAGAREKAVLSRRVKSCSSDKVVTPFGLLYHEEGLYRPLVVLVLVIVSHGYSPPFVGSGGIRGREDGTRTSAIRARGG